MTRTRTLKGEVAQYDRPEWGPLEELVAEPVVGDFMWMHEVELTDGTALHAYKHIDTRRYIHLTANGQAYVYDPLDRYQPVAASDVLEEVFAHLPGLAGVTHAQIRASRRAVDRVRALEERSSSRDDTPTS
jgi:hypothetical protein